MLARKITLIEEFTADGTKVLFRAPVAGKVVGIWAYRPDGSGTNNFNVAVGANNMRAVAVALTNVATWYGGAPDAAVANTRFAAGATISATVDLTGAAYVRVQVDIQIAAEQH